MISKTIARILDLRSRKPIKKEETALRQSKTFLEEMKALDDESSEILN
jgi:hypothetical protein